MDIKRFLGIPSPEAVIQPTAAKLAHQHAEQEALVQEQVATAYLQAESLYAGRGTVSVGYYRYGINPGYYDVSVRRLKRGEDHDYTLVHRPQGTKHWEDLAIISRDGLLTHVSADQSDFSSVNEPEHVNSARLLLKRLSAEQRRVAEIREKEGTPVDKLFNTITALSSSKPGKIVGAIALVGVLTSTYNTYANAQDAKTVVTSSTPLKKATADGIVGHIGETIHPQQLINDSGDYGEPSHFDESVVPTEHHRLLAFNNPVVEPGQVRQIIFKDRHLPFRGSKYCQEIPVKGVEDDSVLVAATDSYDFNVEPSIWSFQLDYYSYDGTEDLTITLGKQSIRACNANPELHGDASERVVFEVVNP